MRFILRPLALLSTFLFSLVLHAAVAQSGGGVKNPYTMSVVALKGVSGVEVSLTFSSINPQRYLLPGIIKEFVAEPVPATKTSPKKFTQKNISLTGGSGSVLVPGFQTVQQLRLKVHVKADGWQDEHFDVVCTVLSDPDLLVQSISMPPQAYTGIPFNVLAVVREMTGASAVTTNVSLKEGAAILAVSENVFVPAGGTLQLSFPNIIASSAGSHVYTIVISGSNPTESTLSNNSSDAQVQVNELTTVQLQPGSMSYSFDSYDYANITANTYSEYDHKVVNFWETSALEFKIWLPSGQVLGSIDELSWEIRTANGTYDAQSLISPVPPIGNAEKRIEILSNTASSPVELTLRQLYTYSHDVDSWVPKDVTTGNQAFVLRPEGQLEVTVRLRSGGNVYEGSASLAVPLPQAIGADSYSFTWLGQAGEDPTDPYVTNWTRRRATSASTEMATGTGSEAIALEETIPGDVASLPLDFKMSQNYPNPFNPTTTFEFALPRDIFASLKVYDMLGREVATVASREFKAGVHRATWNASALPSGMYVYRLMAGEFVAQRKLMLVK